MLLVNFLSDTHLLYVSQFNLQLGSLIWAIAWRTLVMFEYFIHFQREQSYTTSNMLYFCQNLNGFL